MEIFDRVCAEISLDAVRSNMEAFKRVCGDRMLCAVVKADGYGLGAVPVARTVDDLVWGYAVATAGEALDLRRSGIQKPVLVLGYVPEDAYADLIREDVRFALYRTDSAESLSRTAVKLGREALVHLKTDTGMGRIGVFPAQMPDFAAEIASLPMLRTEGIFSHLATADCADRTYARRQAEIFGDLLKELEARGLKPPVCHLSNSAAAMEMRDIPGNMCRIGIALYGYMPSEEMDPAFGLTPALTVKSRIIHLKRVPAGTAVGYGRTFITARESVIATVAVGYADGYPRSLSNRFYMLVHGKKAPVVGRVCMDQTMLDVTDIPEACYEDTVTVIGRDQDEEITVEEAAAAAGSFHYEFLCGISKRVPRVYRRNGQICRQPDAAEWR